MSGLDSSLVNIPFGPIPGSEASGANVLFQGRGQARNPSAVPLERTLQNQLFRHVGLIARSAASMICAVSVLVGVATDQAAKMACVVGIYLRLAGA